jgi:AraC-like DNA-binding protein
MARPVVGADVRLGDYLAELAAIHEKRLPEVDTMTGRVAGVLRRDLSEGTPSVAGVATELAESVRTLQRRLHEEGTSFSLVLDAVRREIAELLVEDPKLSFNEIAYLQGYADTSAFYRAFDRWHGCSPRAYRERSR